MRKTPMMHGKGLLFLAGFLALTPVLRASPRLSFPVAFIENRGQADPRIDYYLPARDKVLSFNAQGLTVSLSEGSGERRRWNVKVDFVGADPAAKPLGEQALPATISYFKGPRSSWTTGLKSYASLRYPNLWTGIDLVYTGEQNRMESRFLIRPGADPKRIRLAYRGADKIFVDAKGRLRIETPLGGFEEGALRAYQEKDGKRESVAANFFVERVSDRSVVGFQLGAYDRERPLIIDPEVLLYAGFIGGTGDDYGYGVAVDAAGNTYVTGKTDSTETTFPEKAGPDLAANGGFHDAFVAKLTPDGSSLIYAGFIGGSGDDVGDAVAVDGSGNAYITGYTDSTEATFPVTVGPDLSANGGYDAFVAKVAPDGISLVYAGFLGGAGAEEGKSIAVDASGNAYVVGYTSSTAATFPTMIGPDLTENGGDDAFVAKIAANGSLAYAGFIGGSGEDFGTGVAVNASGNAFVTGYTNSTEPSFPTALGSFDSSANGGNDTFIVKVAASGTSLVSSGFLGGAGFDNANGIAVDTSGHVYVTGATTSTETTFPVTVGPDLTANGGTDAFVAKVSPDLTTLEYAGFIGGSGSEIAYGIAVDGSGNAYVTGYTDSTETTFPAMASPDLTANGDNDAFLTKVAPGGASIVSSGFLGGAGVDFGNAVAVDGSGNVSIVGHTTSTESTFPKTSGPDLTANGGIDAFVAKIAVVSTCGDGVVEGSEACDLGGGAADSCAAGTICAADTCACQPVSGTTGGGTTGGGTTGGTAGTGIEGGSTAGDSGGGCALIRGRLVF